MRPSLQGSDHEPTGQSGTTAIKQRRIFGSMRAYIFIAGYVGERFQAAPRVFIPFLLPSPAPWPSASLSPGIRCYVP